jgi:hypothetical protein
MAVGAAVTAAALCLGALAASPAVAAVPGVAAACDTHDIYIPGGEAHYTECHGSAQSSVNGWVKDTRADGMCAQVYGSWSDGTEFHSARACPEGEVQSFDFTHGGNINAYVYLRNL